MNDEIGQLKAHIAELEKRHKYAIEELHSMANEQVHRLHGCPYDVVYPEDLEDVADVLRGIKPC